MTAAQMIRHPHAYTLELLALAIRHLPPTFPAEKKKSFEERLSYFRGHPEAEFDDIQETIAELGHESWPQRRAYEDIYAVYGRPSEEAFLLQNLDQGIRDKYERFLHEGGKLNHIQNATAAADIWQASPFERYFTPEEKFAVEQALLVSREAAANEINDLVLGRRKEDYGKLVEKYRVEQRRIAEKLDELRRMADVSSKWQPYILDRARTLAEGWSVVERGINERLLDRELDYWRGTLETFLHA